MLRYAANYIKALDTYALALGIAGDLVLLTSLFVLGGDFCCGRISCPA